MADENTKPSSTPEPKPAVAAPAAVAVSAPAEPKEPNGEVKVAAPKAAESASSSSSGATTSAGSSAGRSVGRSAGESFGARSRNTHRSSGGYTRNGNGSSNGRGARPQRSNQSSNKSDSRMQRDDAFDMDTLPPMEQVVSAGNSTQEITGFIDLSTDGHAVVRPGFSQSRFDAYLSVSVARRLGLRAGDLVTGTAREPRDNDRYWGMKDITAVNGKPVADMRRRRRFEDLVPVYPKEKLVLETGRETLSTRLIDLVAPIGKGQRGLIVSPPKAGKTTIMKEVSTGIAANYPDVHLMAVLIGERPEEVTDIARHIENLTGGKGETAASNFDEPAIEQTRVAEVALQRAKRLVEEGRDVVILLDSITRLARAYNLAIPTSGRTLSGGFDPAALYPPKHFFGAARNFEETGSLTIIGTALVDTGSRMDDLIYEEFKGTGNMELHLDRRLAERRIYPAINVQRSGTRRDDLLFTAEDYQNVVMMHRMLDMLGEEERTPMVVRRLKETDTNKQFLASLKEG